MKASPSKKYGAFGALLLLAVITLAVGVTAPLIVGRRVESVAKERAEHSFISAYGRIRDGIVDRLAFYQQALGGFAGLFTASDAVKRDAFASYGDRLHLARALSAFDAVIFVRRIDQGGKADFLEAVRGDETVTPGGYPDFAVFPLGERDQYAVGDYVYPDGKANGLFGFDFLSDPVWAEAIATAAKTGEITMTQAVRLPGEGSRRGFLLVQPVLRKGAGPGAVPFGFVIGFVRSDELFGEAITRIETDTPVDFVITDIASGFRFYLTPGSEADTPNGRLQAHQELRLVDRSISADFYGPASFGISRADEQLAALILYGGLMAGVLLALFLVVLAMITWRADHLANRMVTELREQKEQNETRSALLQATLDSLPVGVFIARPPEGVVEYLNKAGTLLFNGKFVRGAVVREYAKYVDLVTLKGEPYPIGEIPMITALSGEIETKENVVIKHEGESMTIVRMTSVPVYNENGVVAYVVTVLEDVTAAKEHERQNMEFISIASHQMRTGLASVRWMTDLFGDAKGQMSRKQKNIIRDITSANERMTRLVNDLLNVNRLDLGKIQMKIAPVDLVAVFKDVANELAPRLKQRHLKIAVKTDKAAMVMTDQSMIRETVLNVLSNAVKYTREKTSITVTLARKGGMIEFSVADQGIGIPEKEVGKLFRPFFRASNVESGNIEGTGMGLYITRKIVELSGGKIWAETKEGEGSTFRFTLPVAGDTKSV